LDLAGPVLVGGVPFAELAPSALAALCKAARGAEIAVHVPAGLDLPGEGLRVIRVVRLEGPPEPLDDPAAVELAPEDRAAVLQAGALGKAAEAYRAIAPSVPIGVGVGPDQVAANVQAAVTAGLDFVTLYAVRPSAAGGRAAWSELSGWPQIAVLAEATEGLRAINREEDVDLVYFGCVRDGSDAAKALALGATAVMIGQAALIAAGDASPSDPDTGGGPKALDIDQAAERLEHFVGAMLMEASILARSCGKTDVHNLEPEDLRSLGIEASRATGLPLVGRDLVFRNVTTPRAGEIP
jgi:hypothetical protein